MGTICGKKNQVMPKIKNSQTSQSKKLQQKTLNQNFDRIYDEIKNLELKNVSSTFLGNDKLICCLKALTIIFQKLIKAVIKYDIVQCQGDYTNYLQRCEQKLVIAALAYQNKKEMLRKKEKQQIYQVESELFTLFRNPPMHIKKVWKIIFGQNLFEYNYILAKFEVATNVLNCQIFSQTYDFGIETYEIMLDYMIQIHSKDLQLIKNTYQNKPIQKLLEIQEQNNYSDLQFFLIIYSLCLAQKKQLYCTINLLNWWVSNKKSIIFKSKYFHRKQSLDHNFKRVSNYDPRYDIGSPMHSLQAGLLTYRENWTIDNQSHHFQMRLNACFEAFAKLYSKTLQYLKTSGDRYSYERKIDKLTLAIFAYLDKKQMLNNQQKQIINYQQNILLEFFIQFPKNQKIQEILPIFSGEKSIYYNLEHLASAKQSLANKILNIELKNDLQICDLGASAINIVEKFILKNYKTQIILVRHLYRFNDTLSIYDFFNEQGFSKIFMLSITWLIYKELRINKHIVLEYCYSFQNVQFFQPFIEEVHRL